MPIAEPEKRLITRPLIVVFPARTSRPSVAVWPLTGGGILAPLISMIGEPLKPGCERALSVTDLVIAGKGPWGVIVCGPAPGMLKKIVPGLVSSLAASITSRSEPKMSVVVESAVFVTTSPATNVKVATLGVPRTAPSDGFERARPIVYFGEEAKGVLRIGTLKVSSVTPGPKVSLPAVVT